MLQSPVMTWMVPAGHTGSQCSQWDHQEMWNWSLLLFEHQSERWRSPGTHQHLPTERFKFDEQKEHHRLAKKRKKKSLTAYLWGLLFGGFIFGVLRIEQQGHIEKERRLILGKVNLGDFIGQKLLILLDLKFSQSCLLRLTQSNGSTHHTGILLKDTYNRISHVSTFP